ncbi:hypothetical protein [Stigmatella aurantiaca]|uniref:Conserved uncharacterized protein n=1 Tax=Stigmatella aurantiaca (strain DW4/3-1) TaxID=378806 RepID=E3FRS6_STIAD|nr:hypothetical protein [Stigmatella aurantiaca]ADO68261.1 conserved uncharacterized protein [Stigmatella aurantiaca DW4/3-1]
MNCRRLLAAAVTLLSNASWAIEPPWGKAENLGELRVLEQTSVCTDNKGHYVVVAPHEQRSHQVFYGDEKTLTQVALPPWVLTGTHFLEPRFLNKTANSNFRGLDMRVYSEVEFDPSKKTCSLRCGEKTVPLTWVEADKAQELLLKAKYEPNPQQFEPYALLRDGQGSYYLVERGIQPGSEKNFRVHTGPKGRLKKQEMKDIVSDSEGEIFSTKKGDLRLVVDRAATPMWIEKKRKVELRGVPVGENLPMIYNELGVYTGARLGNPCDDQ